jgi:hypothetical protein
MEINSNDAVKQFYKSVAEKALKNNTTISLMGFKGSDSNIEVLGEMVTKTGGQVDIVDPADVNKNLQSIFADDSVARNILVFLFLPTGFVLSRSAIELDEWEVISHSKSGNKYAKKLGSINSDSNLVIPFELDPNVDYSKISGIVSFQIQIKYTRIEDGQTLLRVCSRQLTTSANLQEVDNCTDLEVMGLYAVRCTAQTAQTGNYTTARLQNYAQLQLMKRLVQASKDKEEAAEVLKRYITHNKKFERQMYLEQVREINQGKPWDETDSLSSDSTGLFGISLPNVLSSFTSLFSSPAPQPVFQQQRANRADDVSNLLWNMRGANTF